MSKTIKKEDIEKLFEKFFISYDKISYHIRSKEKHLWDCPKILWLAFVSNNDSEENIYNTLDQNCEKS